METLFKISVLLTIFLDIQYWYIKRTKKLNNSLNNVHKLNKKESRNISYYIYE